MDILANQRRMANPPQETKTDQLKRIGGTMGMGFGMGMFVGSTVVTLHCLMNRVPLRGMGKQIFSSGAAFGCIFAFGSLVRPG